MRTTKIIISALGLTCLLLALYLAILGDAVGVVFVIGVSSAFLLLYLIAR